MAGLGGYALISSLINLVATLLPEVKNTFFAPSSSSSAQAPNARAVEADLGRLERMLKRIKAILYDAEERNIQDQSVRHWLKEIRELGHEAEYVLEEYMYEVYRAQVEARKASEQNPIKGGHNLSDVYSVQIPYDMVDRIRVINNRFEEIENDRKALRLPEEDAPRRKNVRHTRNPTSPLVEEKSLFGREEEKKKIIDSLLLEGEGFSVLSIVGKGGIGKTTVAQLVYNDKRLKNSFDFRGWVCVSNDFSIERIIQDIIESFTKTSCSIKNTSVLMEELGNRVRGKRVFIVLDDVWNEERRLWEPLCMSLMQATKATILVTTRTISVARIIQTMEPVQLEYLSYDKCCLLFIHYAFQGKDPSDQEELVEIGMEIVKKCRGLPLAVKSIASLLSQEKEHASWMEILQSDLWELDAGEEVLAALQISYERLPIYLKPCLLLCSMFPKDHEYSMNLMSRLWMANGYIESNGRKPIEEVAANYTRELYERSFFDDYNIEYDDSSLLIADTTFKLHDMVHDLALFYSEETCCAVEEHYQTISKEVRHLYFCKVPCELPSYENIPMFRTLSLESIWYLENNSREVNLSSLSKEERLRALHLYLPCYALHLSLGNMKHLRYLCISGDYIEQIPRQSIFSCYSLRILIIRGRCQSYELQGIENLINLEFLLWGVNMQLPESVSQLKRLRVLEIMQRDVDLELPNSIDNLVELNRLVIDNTNLKKLSDSICRLSNLKELIIKTKLNEVSKDFGNLTNLQFFYLEYFVGPIPQCCGELISSCTINVCNLVIRPNSYHCAVGWLKEFNDLKGALLISGIESITSIDDVRNANLNRMRNLETLLLIWDTYRLDSLSYRYETGSNWKCLSDHLEFPNNYWLKKGTLGISIEWQDLRRKDNGKHLKWKDNDILENFQPHHNLKNLLISCYPGRKFPRWMVDPPSCSSLVKLMIDDCPSITSLPLANFHTLKYLVIKECYRLLHLKRESLPPLLEQLSIHDCNSLVEVALLESLVELDIYHCCMLKALLTTSESSEFASDYRHYKPPNEFPSLKRFYIQGCRRLDINENQLEVEEDCDVHIDKTFSCFGSCCEEENLPPGDEDTSDEEILPTEGECHDLT
ncbi:Disease resistance protein (CC-NBS-LRR class) family [Rhynchospora pubera]|uniref:Disease resistance protein (CC-NBS-LRR class) family n=1 Tax=Rhynchospora pubera TaxID=906938 RepID=A0AAV8FDG3_9POAL|nr:Disease resistance protein (CC-NBS-LRR class) family [Rhynchospora pubera]